MQLRCRALLFDIDGTLVDSTKAVIRSWQTWAAEYGVDADEVLRVCHGRRSEDTIAQFLPEPQRRGAKARLDALEMDDLGDVVALPGTRALLPSLPAARWAAVTSGNQVLMRARLAAAGLPAPDVLIAAEDVSTGKPSPEGYLKAAAALGCDITQCLVLEDAPAGVEAGRAAGAHVLAVTTTHHASELGDANAIAPDLASLRVDAAADGLLVQLTA